MNQTLEQKTATASLPTGSLGERLTCGVRKLWQRSDWAITNSR